MNLTILTIHGLFQFRKGLRFMKAIPELVGKQKVICV